MNKILLFLSMSFFAINAMAQVVPSQPAGAPQATMEDNFPKLKKIVLTSIEERQRILNQERQCANSAQTKEAIRACFKDANQQRKQMSEEIKAQHPNVRVNRPNSSASAVK